MEFKDLVIAVSQFVTKLLKEKLSSQLYFHNELHTSYIVTAAQEIGSQSGLTAQEMEIVILAAWFHDTGYTEAYKDHELISIEIATQFLADLGMANEKIADIRSCILATRYPQKPVNLMEMVICDADFYHFSSDRYTDFAVALKKEWEEIIGLTYTQNQWDSINLEMLQFHHYFTPYAHLNLQPKKEENIKKLTALI
jgi:predicted metal-dependent HD superfamily phosphohydrolase